MAGLVLTDASPLIGLARVDGLGWLEALFGTVHVPIEVFAEVVGQGFAADEILVETAVKRGWLTILTPTPHTPPLPDLDEGEAACIRLALARKQPCLLLMDDRAGREIAKERGLPVAGTAAIIGMAKVKGLIPSAFDVFERLHDSDFRLSAPVIATILRRVGER